MQIRQILSEVGTGLRGNVSMTIALVVTTFVSLVLVGVGPPRQQQSEISRSTSAAGCSSKSTCARLPRSAQAVWTARSARRRSKP
jgi:hypothetical protein